MPAEIVVQIKYLGFKGTVSREKYDFAAYELLLLV